MGERTLAAMLLAAGLVSAAGIAAGGWLIGKGMSRFRAEVRTVTVKGLVEQVVVADQATWRLSFRRASDSLADAHARISAECDAVTGFLKARGFEDRVIESQPTRTVDKLQWQEELQLHDELLSGKLRGKVPPALLDRYKSLLQDFS